MGLRTFWTRSLDAILLRIEGFSVPSYERCRPRGIAGGDMVGVMHESASHTVRLRPLALVAGDRFPMDHIYFEVVYAPLLGPTAVLLARAMTRRIVTAGGPVNVDLSELAREIGVGARRSDNVGKKSHIVRAIDRLKHAHVVADLGDHTIGVRAEVPALSSRAVDRMPAMIRDIHAALVTNAGS